jgi:signal transduction histidine kinase
MTTAVPARTVLVDGALAAALLVGCLATAPLLPTWVDGQRPVGPPGYALLVLACLPVASRRRFPLAVLAVTAVAVSAYLVTGHPYGPIFLALVAAGYTVGRHTPLPRSVPAAIGAFLGILPHLVIGTTPTNLAGVVPAAAWIAIPFTVGIARRLVAESRARERAETERRKLDDERLRLATEVHDIVGHGLAAIQLQADIALHVAPAKPEQALAALKAISAASAAALGELRTTLAAIDDTPAASRAPTPGLARLAELCGRVRAAGVEVDLRVRGEQRGVPAEVDVAAYRIVQESLTNVVKHARRPYASVCVDHEPARLVLTVTSPHDGTPIREGFGIRGMRRRAEQLGGQLRLDHGDPLTVRAALPTG